MISEPDKQKLLEELRNSYLVSNACRKLRISRSSFYRWRDMDKEFRKAAAKAQAEGRQYMNDMAESVVLYGIQKRDLKAATYFLSHNHSRYMNKLATEYEQRRRKEQIPSKAQEIADSMEALKILRQKHGFNSYEAWMDGQEKSKNQTPPPEVDLPPNAT